MINICDIGGANHQLGRSTDFTQPGAEEGLSDQIVFGYKVSISRSDVIMSIPLKALFIRLNSSPSSFSLGSSDS